MAGPDMTVLVAAATDWSGVIAAVLSVAASLIVVYIAWKGAKMVIASVRGSDVSGSAVDRYSEAEYRAVWSDMTAEEKEFFNVTTYDDWRSRYRMD